jgi:hypothetical protein
MEVLLVIFGCVAANHLGFIEAVESVLKAELPVFNCPKCLTFWATLFTMFPSHGLIMTFATAFAAAYAALWLELALGFIDKLYLSAYETFINNQHTDDKAATDETDSGEGGGSALSHV